MKYFALILLFIVGCGPSNYDIAKSQVNALVRKDFKDETFMDKGKTGENDPWGNEITWCLTKGIVSFRLEVRSSGPDGLPYTRDDILARVSMSSGQYADSAEALVRGLTRGAFQGAKEGLIRGGK